jgi:UPF0271 protein
MIHEADEAAKRMVAMVEAGAILTSDGTRLKTRIDTICVHGDSAHAVNLAREVRAELENAGIRVQAFSGKPL